MRRRATTATPSSATTSSRQRWLVTMPIFSRIPLSEVGERPAARQAGAARAAGQRRGRRRLRRRGRAAGQSAARRRPRPQRPRPRAAAGRRRPAQPGAPPPPPPAPTGCATRSARAPIRSARTTATRSSVRSFPTTRGPPSGSTAITSRPARATIASPTPSRRRSMPCVVDRARMLKGLAGGRAVLIVLNVNFLNNADIDGKAAPPEGAPNVMVAAGGTQLDKIFDADTIDTWQFHVDWKAPANTRLTGPEKNQGRALSLSLRRPAHQLRARSREPNAGSTRKGTRSCRASSTAGLATASRSSRSTRSIPRRAAAASAGTIRRRQVAQRRLAPAGHLRARRLLPLDGELRHRPLRQYRHRLFLRRTIEFRRPALCGPSPDDPRGR